MRTVRCTRRWLARQGNRVLSAALDLIRHDPRLSAIVIAVRQQSGSRMGIDHQQLLEAIRSRDPDMAEQTMLGHIDRMIGEVEAYRRRQSVPEPDSRRGGAEECGSCSLTTLSRSSMADQRES